MDYIVMTGNIDFQDLISYVSGGSNKWLVFYLSLTLWSCFLPAMYHISVLFIGATPKFYCFTSYGTLEENTCTENVTGLPCETWSYDDSEFSSTLVTEWNLVCNQIFYLPLLQGLYFLGIIIACLLAGPLADIWGRRKTALSLLAVQFVSAYCAIFSSNYWIFLILRMFLGGASHTTWLVILIISMEIIPSEKRALIGTLFQMFWKLGFMNLAFLAYFIRDHFYLQLAMSLFNFILLSYIWVLPESPRWLLSKGKKEEAIAVLQWIASWNNPPEYSEMVLREKIDLFVQKETKHEDDLDETKSSFSHIVSSVFLKLGRRIKYIFGTPILRKRLALILYPWMVTGMSYYGIFLSVKLLNISKYMLIFIAGIVDIVVQFTAIYFFDKFGRIPSIIFSFVICGISGILIFFTDVNDSVIRPILTVVGKALSSVNFQGLGLLGPELFPTPIRSEAFSLMDSLSKFGAAVAPFAVDLLSLVSPSLPNVFFGIMILLGVVCFFFLPETKDMDVPETVQELELASNNTIFYKLKKKYKKTT